MADNFYYQVNHVRDAITFTNEKHTWEANSKNFKNNITTRDRLRNENFVEVFPELKDMYE